MSHLRECFDHLKANKALGVDKMTKEEYAKNLESNLQDLHERLLRGGYKPKPAKRVWIGKPGKAEKRPLAISCLEDKIVQSALKEVLEAIFEPAFRPESHGYRKGQGVHTCLDELGRHIQKEKADVVLEADIRKFFDRMNHDWLIKFVKHRVTDPASRDC